jgi:hypothetical protein
MVSLRTHLRELAKLRAEVRAERDRRYAEVSVEREKALKIKEVADLAALQLAREIQTYKDEKANELRSQIERERGTYATQNDLRAAVERMEALIKPLSDYVLSQQGRGALSSAMIGWLFAAAGLAVAVAVFVTR